MAKNETSMKDCLQQGYTKGESITGEEIGVGMNIFRAFFVARALRRSRAASVATWIAVMLPGVIMAASLGIEVGDWGATQVATQRTADTAATSGIAYLMSFDNPNASSSLQATALYAARMAQLNGAQGAPSTPTAVPLCNGSANCDGGGTVNGYQVSDNRITTTIDSSTAPAKLSVTVSTPVSAMFSYPLIDNQAAHVITATSGAAWLPSLNGGSGANGSGQPCILALGGQNGIVTGTDITDVGSGTIYAPNCTIRSNEGMTVKGSGTITALAIYTGGSFTNIGSGTVAAPVTQYTGQISDPYANDTDLQTALANTNSATAAGAIVCSGSGPSCSGPVGSVTCANGTCTINPGTYSGFSVTGSGNIVLNPGLYVFTGSISLGGSSNVSGSNLTILMSLGASNSENTLTVGGSVRLSISAATKSYVAAWAGAAAQTPIPGILFASLSSGSSNYSGSNVDPNVGVFYYPNGAMTVSGSDTVGSPGCAEVIAYSIAINGTPSFDSSTCVSSYGALSFNSVPGGAQAQLIQ
jgi:hypothetical protein